MPGQYIYFAENKDKPSSGQDPGAQDLPLEKQAGESKFFIDLIQDNQKETQIIPSHPSYQSTTSAIDKIELSIYKENPDAKQEQNKLIN